MTAPVSRPPSPLRAVLAAIDAGARTVAGVRARTGLDPTVVEAAVDHLARARRITVVQMRTLCGGRCGDCPVVSTCGRPLRR
ncbi:hypothetical protein GCM10009557_67550 [Virgisporangium ochraceum]|uniref:Transcriptional regulator HTH-type FeoC domain-containing protein n=1 Tax=Virgisporangium ochraceum TaxID=65505 RepID=A0A8J4EHT9_9ACTN|nr:hypothetical protein Voc01_102560 [Virgisporangium ochraceum]